MVESTFAGSGEMAMRIRDLAWSATPLGAPSLWPESLRTAVGLMLHSHHPMFIWWGPQLTNLYNDAYVPVLGKRHPWALGQPARDIWDEASDDLGPQAGLVLEQGEATWNERVRLILGRNGYAEETYFTFSYSPILDGAGGVGGVFCACTEDTAHVIAERRVRTLRALAERMQPARTADEACAIAAATLAENDADVPFALFYMLDADGRRARLAGAAGLGPGEPVSPTSVDLADGPWPLGDVGASGRAQPIEDLARLGAFPGGPWPESPELAWALPIVLSGQERPAGVLVAGTSPRRRFDDDYRGFLDLVAGHVATAVASARAFEAERRRAEALAERQGATDALTESEARFRNMADHAPVMTWVTDAEGFCTYLSARWYELTGQTPVTGLGSGWLDAIHPDDRDRADAALCTARERQEPVRLECRLRRRDGIGCWSIVAAEPRRGPLGEFLGYVGSVIDIDERKRTEESLARAERQLRLALRAGRMGSFIWEIRSGQVLWSEEHYRLLGLEPERGHTTYERWRERVHAEDLAGVEARIRRALEGGDGFAAEYRVVWPDGTARWVEGRGQVERDASGKAVRMAGVLLDIEARKRLELENERARREAERTNRAKDEFLAMLGHELRNPLAALRNAILITQLDHTPGKQERALDIARRQSEQLARLVDDLLDVARITQGRISLQRERVRLSAVIERAVESTRAAIDGRNHELTVRLPAEPIELDGDPVRLEQVVTNLLSNAAKYTNPGGHIALGAEREGDSAVVRVRDDGVGIAPALLPRLFDLFTQGDRTLDRAQGGLGVGLTVAKRFVELHGGTITASSEGPGRGSELVVRLPVQPPSDAPQARPTTARHARGRVRVLVVEDNPDTSEALCLLVETLGHEVAMARDGPGALAAFRSKPPDVALIDIGLPGMDGYEVARQARELPVARSTMLVALTGYGRDEDKARALSAGFDRHVTKPLEIEALCALLDRQKQRAQRDVD